MRSKTETKRNPHLSLQIRLQPKLGAIFDFPDAQHPGQSVLVTPELLSQKRAKKKTI